MVVSSKHFVALTSWMSPEEGLGPGLIMGLSESFVLSFPLLAFIAVCSSYRSSGLSGIH